MVTMPWRSRQPAVTAWRNWPGPAPVVATARTPADGGGSGPAGAGRRDAPRSGSRRCAPSHSPGSAPPAAPSPGRAALSPRSRRRRSTADGVAADHAAQRAGQGRRLVAVDEHKIRRRRQPPDRPGHRQQRGTEDVFFGDFPDRGGADADFHASGRSAAAVSAANAACTSRGVEFFESSSKRRGRAARARQHDGGGEHGPGERPAPDLIHPGDPAGEGAFELVIWHGRRVARARRPVAGSEHVINQGLMRSFK